MPKKKLSINREKLRKLYWNQNLSPYKIADQFGCSFSTITNRLKEYGIPLKTPAFARTKYPKINFNGDLEEKSYILGFRLGDLNCYKVSEKSETIVARCHTTDFYQKKLIEELFKKYGKVSISNHNNHYQINCFLNNSFDFLLTKDFNPKGLHTFSFIAGYTDAEGNFQINQGKARFKIDSYDFSILNWISSELNGLGINNKFWMIRRREKGKFKQDLWRLTINHALVIKIFIKKVSQYIKHEKQKRNMKICLTNIENRIVKGTVNAR